MPKGVKGFQKGHSGFRNSESYSLANMAFFETDEYKEKQRKIAKERGYGKWMVGKKLSDETRAKIAKANTGRRKLNPKTPENKRIRSSKAWKIWREAVFLRDDYTCQICGIKNKKGLGKTVELNPDHIKPFALYPELRFTVDNGRTLCRPCHMKTDTWGRGSIYRVQKDTTPAMKKKGWGKWTPRVIEF